MSSSNRKLQYFAALATSLTTLFMGAMRAWPSPVLPKFRNNETGIEITDAQISWMVTMTPMGAVLGSLISQLLVDRVGRKTTVLATAVPATIACVILLIGKTPEQLYASRLLSGMTNGMVLMVNPIYVTEIADKEVRGALGTLFKTLMSLGSLIMFGIGPFVSYSTLNYILLSIPLTYFIVCLWIPESPYYYLKKGQDDSAKAVLLRLKGTNEEKVIAEQLNAMTAYVRSDMTRATGVRELYTSPIYRKAHCIALLLTVLQICTGNAVITAYLELIFRQSSAGISGPIISIVYGVVQLGSSMLITVLVDRVGRRPLLMVSCIGVGVSWTAVGLFFYLQDVMLLNKETLKMLSILPIFGFLGYNLMSTIGTNTLPLLILAEIYPTNVKSVASTSIAFIGAAITVFITRTYQIIKEAYGLHTVFWLYGTVGYVGLVLVYFIVPETKGRSFQQIQNKLQNTEAEATPLKELVELKSAIS